ncbi:hypothetical protein BAUCODRAFT_30220 [Baudoinia panamericana UAMH 10762]|uniref:Uncharacterized protein n=1 Tax=Baudoinia panamericana (strain UAMH 10762) TaxID=717646 RepID=M2NKY8_BAUPA|nr:uncharacterized protein BAUCODRAFT_30220 [Baudoinia panamericana UAMH 10762]EMC99810.1 hypothetical protein BAUCODRAFT_30220 [Baudoinia panamericana UAMH 10762]
MAMISGSYQVHVSIRHIVCGHIVRILTLCIRSCVCSSDSPSRAENCACNAF